MIRTAFEQAEVDYLHNEWYTEFNSFNRNTRVRIKGRDEKVTAMQAFLFRVRSAFGKKFPYRHPKTDPATLTPEQKNLQYDRKFWYGKGQHGLMEKLRHRFGYMKRCETREVGSIAETRGSTSTPTSQKRRHGGTSPSEDEYMDEDHTEDEDEEEEDEEDYDLGESDEGSEEEWEEYGVEEKDTYSEGDDRGATDQSDEEGGDATESLDKGFDLSAAESTAEQDAVSKPGTPAHSTRPTGPDADHNEDMNPIDDMYEDTQAGGEVSTTAASIRTRKGSGRRTVSQQKRTSKSHKKAAPVNRDKAPEHETLVARGYTSWLRTMHDLTTMMESSWATCGPKELAR
ncbi:hypothetical protein V565_202830, partial [Rhizoctonia solani 123E]